MANKTCTKCKQIKPISDFYKAHYTWTGDGKDYYCKYCRNGTHLNSVRNNKKQCSLEHCTNSHYAKDLCRMHYSRKVRTGSTDTKSKVVEIFNVYDRDGIKVLYRRNWMLKHYYKMTLDTFLERSINGCEICGNKPERNLHVDHDHKCCNSPKSCGKCVRGIICNKCNMAVDKMENDLMRADYPQYELIKQYLERYNG